MITVMVVDDEVPIRQWLEFCISKLDGYRVVGTAGNGAEGYSLFRKTMPDIIITDIRMPVMDGLEMLGLIGNMGRPVKSMVLTSYEDFSYVRHAMKNGATEYILKTEITEEQLKEMLDKASADMQSDDGDQRKRSRESLSDRNQYLRTLVLQDDKREVTESVLDEYEIFLDQNGYVAIDLMTREESFLKMAMPEQTIFTNVMKVPLKQNHVLFVGNFSKSCPPGEQRRQELLQEYCRQILQTIDCKIGCSDICSQVKYVGRAMRQAYDRASLAFYYPKLDVFCTQQVGKRRIDNGEKYKIRFTRELINQNLKRAMEIKDEMKEEIRREQVADVEYIKKMYLFFLTSLFHMMWEDEERVEEKLADLGAQIEEAVCLEDLDRVMESAVAVCGAAGRADYSAPVRNAVSYMEEHFSKALSLSDVAFHVGLSSEYLSRLFKEETGVKFVVYLNNLRLKNALHLLETTQMKVYEVAEQVGYSNLSYFSTVFKKKFGQNPFDYKNNCGRA